ncbi:A24 family peptidase [Leucobacter alluvii]|uniref:A24 family peptidase n=1 Tax=Leucobacter alluvii TaxID=340321 RepID=A0ABN3B4W0_9MICO
MSGTATYSVLASASVVASASAIAGLALFAAWSTLLSVIDIRERRLPNRLLVLASGTTIPLLLASAVVHGFHRGGLSAIASDAAGRLIWDTVLVAAAFGAVFAALWRWSPQGIGGGDVKLSPLVGAAVGFTGGWTAATLTVVGAFAAAAIWSIVRRPRPRPGALEKASAVPFAPCLFASAWATIACI